MKKLIVLTSLIVIVLGIYVFMTGDDNSVRNEMPEKLQRIEY